MILIEKEKLGVIESAVKARTPVMLVGETGIGKTTIISELAEKHKKQLIRLSLNDQVGREDLIGKYGLKDGATLWSDGALLSAMRSGAWIVLDELNSARPEVLFTLHAILDDERAIVLQEKDGERVRAHKNFCLFGTINPTSYHGTKNLNQAFFSRFVVVDIAPLSPDLEAQLIEKKLPAVDKEIISKVVGVGQELRDKHAAQEIGYFCSTRDLIMAAALIGSGLDFDTALSCAVLNKIPAEDLSSLEGSPKLSKISERLHSRAQTFGEKLKELEQLKARADTEARRLEGSRKSAEFEEKRLRDYLEKISVEVARLEKVKREVEETKKLKDAALEKIARNYLLRAFGAK